LAHYSRKDTKVGILLALLIVLLATNSVLATGARLYVCKIGCEHSSIGSAVSAAGSGDVIIIEQGTYQENLKVDFDLTLSGTDQGEVTIKSNVEGRPAVVAGPRGIELMVSKLTVSGSRGAPADPESGEFPDGLSVRGEAKLTLSDVIITGNEACGVRLTDKSALETVSSSFSYNGTACCGTERSQIDVRDTRISGNGIVLSGSSSGYITDTTVSNHNKRGLVLGDESSVTIRDSKVGTCETCIQLTGNSSINLANSTVEEAGDGISLAEQSTATINESEIIGSTSGIDMEGSTRVAVRDSKISKNDHGVSLFGLAELYLENCRIAYNDIGLRANPGSDVKVSGCGVKFYNNFEGHTRGLTNMIEESLQDRCG